PKKYALVITPRGSPVVCACCRVGRRQTVIDQIVRIDHAGSLEPGPTPMRPGQVPSRRAAVSPVRQRGRNGEKKLIGNGVFVLIGLLPPHSSAAGIRL